MSVSKLKARDFAQSIIEGPGGMLDFEEREVVCWHDSERVAAAIWTMRCLANPHCEGSEEALAGILAVRVAKKQAPPLDEIMATRKHRKRKAETP